MSLRAISYGGGVQSTALVVLAVTGRIEADLAIFANTGDHAENPDTIAYVRAVAAPYAKAAGLELVERNRGGVNPDLYERLTRPGSRFLGIPIRMADTGAPGNRSCTRDYKIYVIARELRSRGASQTNPATVMVGISTDEIERVNARKALAHEHLSYPLIDLHLSRSDCMRVIADAGLPVPPKSACWFCPFHSADQWRRLRTEHPDRFERAAQLEDLLNTRRAEQGRDPVYFSRSLLPLRVATPDMDQLPFDDVGCDNGWCMT